MKRVVLSFLVLSLSAGVSFAGQFGPVVPAVKSGEVSQEIGYFRSVGTWEADAQGFDDGELTQNQVYVQAGYGFAGDWEAYFRIGGSDLSLEKAFAVDDSEMDDSFSPFVTIGARGLLYNGETFDFGAFVQGTYFGNFEDSKKFDVSGTLVKETLRLKDLWDVNAGLALQAKFGSVSVYGGPVAYYGRGRLETEVEVAGLKGTSESDYEEEGNLGGMAGVKIALSENLNVYLEGQYKSELSAGGAVTYLRVNY